MINERNVTYQYIANVTANVAAIANQPVEVLPEGACALVDAGGLILDDAAAVNTVMRVAQRINGQLVFSPYFVPANSQITDQASIANTQQVSFLGSNGTATGRVDANAQSTYMLRLTLKNTQGVFNNTALIKSLPFISAAGTQRELVTGLKTVFDRVMAREPRRYITCTRVSNAAQVTAGFLDANTHISVVNGSRAVVSTNNAGVAAPMIALADGAVVRINNVIYTVSGGTVNGFNLDIPYEGATALVAGGILDINTVGATAGLITTPDAAGNNYGLRFAGVEYPDALFNPVTDTPDIVSFDIGWNRTDAPAFSGADLTTITNTTAPAIGLGTYKQIAYNEVYTTMNEGNAQICSYPPTNYRRAALVGARYRVVTIVSGDANYRVVTTGQVPVSVFTTKLAILDAGGGGALGDGDIVATILGV